MASRMGDPMRSPIGERRRRIGNADSPRPINQKTRNSDKTELAIIRNNDNRQNNSDKTSAP